MNGCQPCLTFNYQEFIAIFPAYSNATLYPAVTLQQYWNSAIFYVSPTANFGDVHGCARQYAINLMTAHLAYLAGLIAAGTVPYLMQDATIDKVHVGLTPPPLKNQFQWWLSASPYGQQLLALLQVNSVGGHYIGGSAVLRGFRPNGSFSYYGQGAFLNNNCGGGNTGNSFTWVDVISTTFQMMPNTGYIVDSPSLVTLTLPLNTIFGSVNSVVAKGVGGWQIAQNGSQSIRIGVSVTTVGASGYIASTNVGDAVNLVCTVPNTSWENSTPPQGIITVI
jgi:hypothetical protein